MPDLTQETYFFNCSVCGVLTGMAAAYRTRLQESHATFYCLNGHSHSYNGKTKAEKLQAQLDDTRRRLSIRTDERDSEHYHRKHQERRVSVYKGKLTLAKRRAEKEQPDG